MNERYFLEFSFKGTAYHGWQSQLNAVTVQSVLEESIMKITGERPDVTGAGRTDAGVHASFFMAHFNSRVPVADPGQFIYSLNCVLPQDIAVRNIRKVRADAHARYSALSRTYEYTISRTKNPFITDFAWIYTNNLDMEAMNMAAGKLQEVSDFSSFSKLHSNVKNNICRVFSAKWTDKGDILRFTISADRFLRNMVRAIVGTLICVGKGQISQEEFVIIIGKKNRSFAKFSAPPQGLCLTDIKYPEDIFLSS